MHVQVKAKPRAEPIVAVDGLPPVEAKPKVKPIVEVDERSEWQKLRIRILTYRQLREEKLQYTRQHLMRMEKAGLFPCRIQVGGNKVGWLEHEVDEWIMRRVALSRGAA